MAIRPTNLPLASARSHREEPPRGSERRLRNAAEVLLDMPAGSYKLACKGPDGETYWIPCVKKHLVIRNAVEKLKKSAKDLKNEVELVATREIWTSTLSDALALVDKAKAKPIDCRCKRCSEKKGMTKSKASR